MCANDMRFDVYVCTNMDGWMCFNYVKNWRVCFARNGGDQRLIKLTTGALTYVALWWIDVMLQEEGEIVKNADRCFLHITLVNGILCKRINVEAQILMVRYTDNFYWCPQTDTVKGKKTPVSFCCLSLPLSPSVDRRLFNLANTRFLPRQLRLAGGSAKRSSGTISKCFHLTRRWSREKQHRKMEKCQIKTHGDTF